VESDKKEVNVSWPEPQFSDETMLTRVEYNLNSGQVFTWGDYLVIYFSILNHIFDILTMNKL